MSTFFPDLAQLRQIEAEALAAGLPLMERAGKAAADVVLRWQPEVKHILILIGPGNNGGDGQVCARHLHAAGLHVTTCQHDGDADFANCDLIVDALFGIGLARDLSGPTQKLVDAANASGKPILALDTPSGLDAYTGMIRGSAIRASQTLTFLADKPGLHTGAGCDYAGKVSVEKLGVDSCNLPQSGGELIAGAPAALQTLQRRANSHKGSYGTAAIFGGDHGMYGAPLLAGRAALKLGTGKVQLGFIALNHPDFDPLQPELMLHSAQDLLNTSDATLIVAGPGLGKSDAAHQLLIRLLPCPQALLLDADALNLLAHDIRLQSMLIDRATPAILTPHPAEAARLLGCSTAIVQADRILAAKTLAQRLNCIVLLKGAGSVCCDGKNWSINASGNAALSNAGQGDTLAGILAALVAQGLPGFDAARCAAWLHGAAADEWKQTHPAGIGLTASEVIDLARGIMNRAVTT